MSGVGYKQGQETVALLHAKHGNDFLLFLSKDLKQHGLAKMRWEEEKQFASRVRSHRTSVFPCLE